MPDAPDEADKDGGARKRAALLHLREEESPPSPLLAEAVDGVQQRRNKHEQRPPRLLHEGGRRELTGEEGEVERRAEERQHQRAEPPDEIGRGVALQIGTQLAIRPITGNQAREHHANGGEEHHRRRQRHRNGLRARILGMGMRPQRRRHNHPEHKRPAEHKRQHKKKGYLFLCLFHNSLFFCFGVVFLIPNTAHRTKGMRRRVS